MAVVTGQEKVAFMKNMGVDEVVDASTCSLSQEDTTRTPLHKAIKAVASKGDYRSKCLFTNAERTLSHHY